MLFKNITNKNIEHTTMTGAYFRWAKVSNYTLLYNNNFIWEFDYHQNVIGRTR